jgi:hypothetical protein
MWLIQERSSSQPEPVAVEEAEVAQFEVGDDEEGHEGGGVYFFRISRAPARR